MTYSSSYWVQRFKMGATEKRVYELSVFLNCPFDEQYAPFFQAAIFAISDCGFSPCCALEVTDASEVRIHKIYSLIAECRLGIHDLSRTQLDEHSQLPRFNMPLEFGIFLGAKFLVEDQTHFLFLFVFAEESYRYQKYLSDIAGQDVASHHNDLRVLIGKIRDWLAGFSAEPLPSGSVVWERYERFRKELNGFCKQVKHKPEELTYLDYLSHVKRFVPFKADILKTGLKMRWGNEVQDPFPHNIRDAIQAFKGGSNSFAILTKSELTYMQCIGGKSIGYSLEYQEGSTDDHYECIDELTEEDVIEALQAYRTSDASWKTRFHWKKQRVD